MKRRESFIVWIIIVSLSFTVAAQNNQHLNVFHTFHERDGLPNFFRKVLRGDSVTVAYLGGSITAQEGYRVLSFNWIKKQFPNAKFRQVNAAIGGTGSKFGVFRLHDHVLKFKPDLLFVEFAVNDFSEPRERILRSMEGIVRETWSQNPKTDFCFVYTLSEPFIGQMEKNLLPTSVLSMEEVADYYRIPSINFGVEVSKRLKDQTIILANKEKQINGVPVFSPDGVHPYIETGHVIYFDILKQSFEKMNEPKKEKLHKLNKPICPDYFAKAQMINPFNVSFTGNWDRLDTINTPDFRFKNLISQIAQASQSGATMYFKFKGKAVGFCDIIGPGTGKGVILQIDGFVKDTIFRFDKYCTYNRLNNYLIDDLSDTEHNIVFRVMADPIDKVKILSQMGNLMKNPDDFKDNYWSVGKILIDGDLKP